MLPATMLLTQVLMNCGSIHTQGYTQPLTEVLTNVLKSLSNISGASSDIQDTDFFNLLQLTV